MCSTELLGQVSGAQARQETQQPAAPDRATRRRKQQTPVATDRDAFTRQVATAQQARLRLG